MFSTRAGHGDNAEVPAAKHTVSSETKFSKVVSEVEK